MKFEQAKDIIEFAVSFHRFVGGYYQDCLVNTQNPRLRMILNYLVEHEKKILEGFTEYEENAPVNILETWFQFSTCSEKFNLLKENLNPIKPSIDEVKSLTISLYACIITQFENLAEDAEVDKVKDVFINIAMKEKKEQKKLARNFQLMEDL